MNFYPKHIGDYHTKAGRCSMVQHGAFNVLMDKIYDSETFPTLDDAINITWANSDEEIDAVKFVLKRFFVEKNGIFFQKRIMDEIIDFRIKSISHSYPARIKSAKNDTEKESIKAEFEVFKQIKDTIIDRMRTHYYSENELCERSAKECERSATAEFLGATAEKNDATASETGANECQPITNNQEPITNNQEPVVKATIQGEAPDIDISTVVDRETGEIVEFGTGGNF